MNIKPMLARLQSTIGRDDLIEQMVLLPGPKSSIPKKAKSPKSLTLVVAYNGSPGSHTALDLTLLIAHQTRLATNKEVTVKIAYVIDENQNEQCPDVFSSSLISSRLLELSSGSDAKSAVLTVPKLTALATSDRATSPKSCCIEVSQNCSFEKAEHILWQARCLIEEWRDAFIAHLRVGSIAEELRKVVELEAADLLCIGCCSANHPIIQKLGSKFPCPVLGIPDCIEDKCPTNHN